MPTKFWRHYEIKVKSSTTSTTDMKEGGAPLCSNRLKLANIFWPRTEVATIFSEKGSTSHINQKGKSFGCLNYTYKDEEKLPMLKC